MLSPEIQIVTNANLPLTPEKGVVVVAGDVWWFSDMTPEKDEEVLKIADWIIPGHGKKFEAPK